jgi:polyhydroxybutyrate depolymerase
VPASYDNRSPVPLVFDIHGYFSNKDQQEGLSGFSAKAEAEGFVVVRPAGLSSSWNAGEDCCGQAQDDGLDDVGLMKAIVAAVSEVACIDPKRVYATGLSNGGALSHRLACDAADVFAAVAPVSYPIAYDPTEQCEPSRPISVLHFHGANDLLVPPDGGFTSMPIAESFAYWKEANGCSGDPAQVFSEGDSRCDSYASCEDGVEVTLCTLDGGHILYTNDDLSIVDFAWDRLKGYTLP